MQATAQEIRKLMAQRVVTVDEMAKITRLGRKTAYKVVNDGTIRSVRAGNRILVPTSAIREYLDGQSVPAA
jgi:excisionase family DNA binding protein